MFRCKIAGMFFAVFLHNLKPPNPPSRPPMLSVWHQFCLPDFRLRLSIHTCMTYVCVKAEKRTRGSFFKILCLDPFFVCFPPKNNLFRDMLSLEFNF
jgi:hypothetical protein